MAAAGERYIDLPRERYLALLGIARSISVHADVPALLRTLCARLHDSLGVTYLAALLHDESRNSMRLHVVETVPPSGPARQSEFALDDSPAGWVWRQQQPLVIADTVTDSRYPEALEVMRRRGVRSFCAVPLNASGRRLGALVLGAAAPHGLPDADFARLTADWIGAAIENHLLRQDAAGAREGLAGERERLQLLLDLTERVSAGTDLRTLFRAVSASIRRALPCDLVSLILPAGDGIHLRVEALDFPGGSALVEPRMLFPIEGSVSGEVLRTGRALAMLLPDPAAEPATLYPGAAGEGILAACAAPLTIAGFPSGTLALGRRGSAGFDPGDLEFVWGIARQMAAAVSLPGGSRIPGPRGRGGDPRPEPSTDEIIGSSPALQRVMEQVRVVAPTNASVLLLGETGTGKELLARAIHRHSARARSPLVKANCAAIPLGLLESDLFGHEKGAFTGAVSRKAGRFELAGPGTLFLDEVGDIPLELQPKLLRVLQEREFERLGSGVTLRSEARLVAATHRDLPRLVAEGRFRLDLFHRLNIFPIEIPPLRAHAEDIPLLVRHFVARYSVELGKRVDVIPDSAIAALTRDSWPGNVRELQNFIERAVILSSGPVLEAPLAELERGPAARTPERTLVGAERQCILDALRECDWTVGGAGGAARLLGLPRTTLIYKMRRLGISRRG